MTTKLTIAPASGKMRVIILQFVLQQGKQQKIEKKFYDLQFYELQLETNRPINLTSLDLPSKATPRGLYSHLG